MNQKKPLRVSTPLPPGLIRLSAARTNIKAMPPWRMVAMLTKARLFRPWRSSLTTMGLSQSGKSLGGRSVAAEAGMGDGNVELRRLKFEW
jgi:hypothetical protein